MRQRDCCRSEFVDGGEKWERGAYSRPGQGRQVNTHGILGEGEISVQIHGRDL